MHPIRFAAVAVAALIFVAPPSHAERAKKPWDDGISKRDRRRANKLFAAGNERFREGRHASALARYQKAIEIWKHPLIELNAAAALLELGRPLRAAVFVEAVKRQRRHLARDDQRKLDRLVGAIAASTGIVMIRVEQAGVVVTIDGREVAVGPATVSRRVLSGKHEVVARRRGLEPQTQRIEVDAGARVEVAPVLFVIEHHWRWSRWKPWALVGLGAAVAAVGVPLILDAGDRRTAANQFAGDNCANGCLPNTPERGTYVAMRNEADRREQLALGAFASGGAIAAIGLLLAIANRPTRVERPAGPRAGLWRAGDGLGVRVSAMF